MHDPEGSHYVCGIATPRVYPNDQKESYAPVWRFATQCYIMTSGWQITRWEELRQKDRIARLFKIEHLLYQSRRGLKIDEIALVRI